MGELAYPLLAGWGCTFDVSALVPPPPQAATANEPNATRGMAYINLNGLIRDLAFAALLLSAGALADRVGLRTGFLAGLAVFGLASAACAAATPWAR